MTDREKVREGVSERERDRQRDYHVYRSYPVFRFVRRFGSV